MATAFFNPSDPFSLTGTEWEVQTQNPSTSKDRAQALKSGGDELASKLYNSKNSESATYVAKTTSAKTPKIGDIKNGFHIDTVAVAFTNTGYVMMTITGHKHGANAHPACKKYSTAFSGTTGIGVLFGCPSAIPCCTIPNNAGVRSVNYQAQVNHVDELGSQGEFLAGENYDGSETWQVELCDTGTISATSGYDMTACANSMGNTAAQTSSATLEKHIQADAA